MRSYLLALASLFTLGQAQMTPVEHPLLGAKAYLFTLSTLDAAGLVIESNTYNMVPGLPFTASVPLGTHKRHLA